MQVDLYALMHIKSNATQVQQHSSLKIDALEQQLYGKLADCLHKLFKTSQIVSTFTVALCLNIHLAIVVLVLSRQ